MSTLVKSPTCSIVPTKLSPITTPPLMAGYWYSHSPHIALITDIHSLCPLLLALISLTYTHSVQCALIQLLRTIVPKPLWLAAAADRGAVVTNNNKERDATTWLGTIVWISLGPRKQLLGSKWHKSECATSTLVNFYHCNTTNTRRPHKCRSATNTSLVDRGTLEPPLDNMTTRVLSHLVGVSSQLTTPDNNIWDSAGPWSKLTPDPPNALDYLWVSKLIAPSPCPVEKQSNNFPPPKMEKDKSWRCWNHKQDGNKRKLSGS